MDKRFIILGIFILFCGSVYAQVATPPQDYNTVIINKIQQEEATTRKFTSDELSRQRDVFFKDYDSRAQFYEKEFFNALNTAVIKLTAIWAAIVFMVFGLSNILRITLESKRYKRMKDSIRDELKMELLQKQKLEPIKPVQTPMFKNNPAGATLYEMPPDFKTPKEGFFARRKQKKALKEMEIKRAEIEKAQQLLAAMGMLNVAPPQPEPPKPEPAIEQPVPKVEVY